MSKITFKNHNGDVKGRFPLKLATGEYCHDSNYHTVQLSAKDVNHIVKGIVNQQRVNGLQHRQSVVSVQLVNRNHWTFNHYTK